MSTWLSSAPELPDFYPADIPAEGAGEERFLLFADEQVVVPADGSLLWTRSTLETGKIPFSKDSPEEPVFVGMYRGSPCYCLELTPGTPAPADAEIRGLRSFLGAIPDHAFNMLGRASQLLKWMGNHRYCGRCGNPTVRLEAQRATHCDHCNLMNFPRISPCIIVVVKRENECLLAHNSAWEKPFYSALAGFVEAGESVEEAVHREVYEETAIRIHNLTYFGSQPWPFPGQLMLGFHAEYLSGDIQVDGKEIVDARWWRHDRLPRRPDSRSLSGRLIDHFCRECPAVEGSAIEGDSGVKQTGDG